MNASLQTEKTSPIEMADFVYPEFSKRISETISAREDEKKRQQQNNAQLLSSSVPITSSAAFGSSAGSSSSSSSSSSFSSGGGFLDGLFKKCKIESAGGSSEQSALLYKGKQ